MPTDGNCFFSSIATAYLADESYVHPLRQFTIRHIISNWDDFSPYALLADETPPTSPQHYAAEMSQSGVPVSQCEIEALAQLFAIHIQIHTPSTVIHCGPPNSESKVFLKYFGNHEGTGHYEPWHPNYQPQPEQKSILTNNPCNDEYIRISNLPTEPTPTSSNIHDKTSPENHHPNQHASHPSARRVRFQTPSSSPPPHPTPPPVVQEQTQPETCSTPNSSDHPSDAEPTIASLLFLPLPPRTQWEIQAKIFGQHVICLLDSGSTYSLLDASLVPPESLDTSISTPVLRTAKGDSVHLLGTTQANVYITDKSIKHNFYVCENLAHSAIFGLSWLYATKSILNFKSNKYTLTPAPEQTIECNLYPDTIANKITNSPHTMEEFTDLDIPSIYTLDRRVVTSQSVLIPNNKSINIPIKIHPFPTNEPALLTLNNFLAKILGAPHIAFFIEPDQSHITIFNASDKPVLISQGQLLGKFYSSDHDLNAILNKPSQLYAPCPHITHIPDLDTPVAPTSSQPHTPSLSHSTQNIDSQPISFPLAATSNSNHVEILIPPDPNIPSPDPSQFFKIYDELTPEQHSQVTSLLTEYKSVFATSLNDIKTPCTYVAHLPLRPDSTVRYTPQYKLSDTELEFALKYVHRLEEASLVRKQRSNYNHPVFLLQKRKENDNDPDDYRFIINLKNLNSCLMRSNFALPSNAELISRVAGKRYLWKCDAFSGYYQIPLSEESSQLCAFTLNSQTWVMTRLPQGGALSMQVYCQILSDIFAEELNSQRVNIYVDDFFGGSNDFNEFLDQLKCVFVKLKKYNMFFHPKKSYFGFPEISLLGAICSASGHRPDPKRFRAIEQLAYCSTKKEAKRTLGHLSFHRKYLRHYAKRVKPIQDVTNPDATFKWCPEFTQIIISLYNDLKSISLPHFDNTLPCRLITDGSKVGIAAEIHQMTKQGNWIPYAFWSRSLTKPEQNLVALHIEILACCEALNHFRSELQSITFEIQTDAIGLTTILNMKSPSPRMARYIAVISQFSISRIVYKPGDQNQADACSRAPDPENKPSLPFGPGPALPDDEILSVITPQHHYSLRKRTATKPTCTLPCCNPSTPNNNKPDKPSKPKISSPQLSGNPSQQHTTTQLSLTPPTFLEKQNDNLSPDSTSHTIPPNSNPHQSFDVQTNLDLDHPQDPTPDITDPNPQSPDIPSPPPENPDTLINNPLPPPTKTLIHPLPDQIGLPLLTQEQAKDPEILSIRHKILSKQTEKFQIIHDAVFTSTNPPKAYIPQHLRPILLHESHDSQLAGGHFQNYKMHDRLKNYYWPSMTNDISTYAKSCITCQRYNYKNYQQGTMTPIEPKFVNEMVAVDIKYCPKSSDGYSYLLVFVEMMTRFSYAIPLKTLTTAETCEAMKKYVLTFGVMKMVLTDYGSSFWSQPFKELMKSLGSKLNFSPVGAHLSSGSAETHIKSIGNALATFCQESLTEWTTVLPSALWVVNTSKRFSLNASPFQLMLGYEPNSPASLLFSLQKLTSPPQKLLDQINLRHQAQARYHANQLKQKQYFDSKRRHKQFFTGEKVLIFRKSKLPSSKFRFSWHGPFKIMKATGKSSYLVKVLHRNKYRLMKYHEKHIKKYIRRPKYLDCGPPNPQNPCPVASLQTTIKPQPQIRIASWNVNSFRTLKQKKAIEFFHANPFDILCLQETKCTPDIISEYFLPCNYFCFSISSQPNTGYAGVSLITKTPPQSIAYGFNDPDFDKEARIITAHFKKFSIINCYIPYSGNTLTKLPQRSKWFSKFSAHVQQLIESNRKIIIAGDFNVISSTLDIHPALTKFPAGTTDTEMFEFQMLLQPHLIDTFRHFHPTTPHMYTSWPHGYYRAKDQGIRLDYILITNNLLPALQSSSIHTSIQGSDHAPISASFNLSMD